MDRRSLLRLAGLGALGTAAGPALAACGGGGSGGGDVGNAGKDLVPWPAYVPFAGPRPDAPGDETGVQPLYLTYPAQVVKSVPDPAGDGSVVTASVVSFGAPPKPAGRNQLWQALNRALNVDLRISVIPDPEYGQKMATLMASGSTDLPDIIMFTNLSLPRRAEFIRSVCADLSDLVGGDAVKDYPNLANIPTYAWQGMGRIGGRIFGVPLERPKPANSLFVNRTLLNDAGAPVDWTQEQLLGTLSKLTTGNRYGTGWYKTLFGGLSAATYHAGALGAPNVWTVRDGAFAPAVATPQFEAALGVMRQITEARAHYPDSLTVSSTDMQNHFYNGTVASIPNGFGFLAPQTLAKIAGRFELGLARPYSPAATPWLGAGMFGFVAFKKASPERLKLLLRVVNQLSAPFGTSEYELNTYGVEGVHFTKDADGVRTTELYDTENTNLLPVRYLGTAPSVLYLPGAPAVAQAAYDWQRSVLPRSVANPATGLRSATAEAKGAQLDQILGDGIAAITFNRKPLSAWPSVVEAWRAAGGTKVAEEYATEYAAAQ